MKKVFISLVLILVSIDLVAQFKNEKELVAKIKSFTENSTLNDFLIAHKLIDDNPSDFAGKTFSEKALEDGGTQFPFHAGEIKVDIFRKNLFGGPENEIIMQLREPGAYAVNIFYYKGNQFVKAPFRIEHYFADDPSYDEQSFSFSFENIFKEDEYCLMTQNAWSYVRSTNTEYTIYRISPDALLSLYSFSGSGGSYSGLLRYMYGNTTEFEFKLINSQYPKVLILKTTFDNEVADQRSDNSDILSGKQSSGTTETIVQFLSHKGMEKSKTVKKKENIYVNSMEDLTKLKLNTCDTNTTLFITEYFMEDYLREEVRRPVMVRLSTDSFSVNYYQCCLATLKDGYLYTSTLGTNGKVDNSKHQLRPAASSLFRSDINSGKLYGYKQGYDEVILKYFPKDTLIKGHEWEIIPLSDPNVIYKIEDGEIIIMNQYGRFLIPFKEAEKYVKPEILQLINKGSKK